MIKTIEISSLELLVLDFDGVLTNNYVYIDQSGNESVRCSRADGLAFDALKKLPLSAYILSSELNPVVTQRAQKLGVPVLQGCKDKWTKIKELSKELNISTRKMLYVGNDLNDYEAMINCGYSACPSDSHPKIKRISQITLNSNGGNGVMRELLEETMGLDLISLLYN